MWRWMRDAPHVPAKRGKRGDLMRNLLFQLLFVLLVAPVLHVEFEPL